MDAPEKLFEKKYRIGKLLGKGGMGVVHAATHVHLGKEVAIKRIPREAAHRDGLADRLLREARTLARLDHPNIVRILDFGVTDEGEMYIVMELIEGDTLAELVERAARRRAGKGLPIPQALTIAVQVADAIANAHTAGIIHRDLKPENIMVLRRTMVRVLDFGLAKEAQSPAADAAKPPGPTNPANIVGTPRFMAPEQVRGLPVDGRTDIYAVGVLLYQAITAHTPFDRHEDESTNNVELMGFHLFGEPRPIQELVPECPQAVSTIVMRCLAKQPEARYQAAPELAAGLRAALNELVSPIAEGRKGPTAATVPAASTVREVRETEPAPASIDSSRVLPFALTVKDPDPPPSRQVRETEPAPATIDSSRVLPFAPTVKEREPEDARAVRDKEPMPRSSPRQAVPLAQQSQPRGRGHTERMLPAAGALVTSPAGAPSQPRGRGHTERMMPPVQAVAAPGERSATTNSPTGISFTSGDRESPRLAATSGGAPAAPRPPKRIPRYVFAPIGGLVLAFVLIASRRAVRSPHDTPAAPPPEPDGRPSAVPTAPASTPTTVSATDAGPPIAAPSARPTSPPPASSPPRPARVPPSAPTPAKTAAPPPKRTRPQTRGRQPIFDAPSH